MNCKQTYKLLSDFIDREFPRETYAEIEVHLDSCPHCHAFLNTLKMTIRLSQRQKFVIIPEDVHNRLVEFLKNRLNIT